MSIFDASGADQDVSFPSWEVYGIFRLSNEISTGPTNYTWESRSGHRISATGDFSYSNGDIAGTVTRIEIDLGNDGDTDVVIDEIANVDISHFLTPQEQFWRALLSGSDTFIGQSDIAGDASTAANGDVGSSDAFISLGGNGSFLLAGDHDYTMNIASGGNDTFDISGAADGQFSTVIGDISWISTGGSYKGGEDIINIDLSSGGVTVFGDAKVADGRLIGGADHINVVSGFEIESIIVGDAFEVGEHNAVNVVGGDDFITTTGPGFVAGDAETLFSGLLIGGDDVIRGGDASDLIGDVSEFEGGIVFGGADTIHGGMSADNIIGDVSIINLWDATRPPTEFSGGDDTLFGNGGNDAIFGDVGYISVDDIEIVTFGDDVIYGGDGDDEIFGDFYPDFDFEHLGGGNDTIEAGSGNDTVHGNGGDDTIEAGLGNDTIYGNSGDDRIFGDSGNDHLDGGSGNDYLIGGGGADQLIGGTGNDEYWVDNAGDTTIENAGEGYDRVYVGGLASWTLSTDTERLTFTDTGNHVGRGNAGDNRLEGNAGNDKFVIDAGGADVFSGGSGQDSFDARSSATGIRLYLNDQSLNAGAVAGDTFASVETFTGSSSAGDIMKAGAGRARFAGSGGDDRLIGGNQHDYLRGDGGDDDLRGGNLRDTLIGGTGDDDLYGGKDRDQFRFVETDFGQDTIHDFEDGLDTLRFFSAVADEFSDFTITGNGTSTVTLTLAADPANTITINGSGGSNVTITEADVLFY